MEYEVIPGLVLHVDAYTLPPVASGEEVAAAARSLLGECGSDVVLAGLDERPDACRAIVAYLHMLEAMARGSRIRNHNLRFLMEYYGESQLRVLLEKLAQPRWLLAVYKPRCSHAVRAAVEKLGAEQAEIACDPREAYLTVEASVLEGLREGY